MPVRLNPGVAGPVWTHVPLDTEAGCVGFKPVRWSDSPGCSALLAVLASTVGLGGAGWATGVACGLFVNGALARGLAHHGSAGLGPADRVTLARAVLACGVAALTADSFVGSRPRRVLVALTAVALALDAVDGRVARRTGTVSELGARFDMEVDAFLILVLSVYVAPAVGWWVLAIGLMRYALLAGRAAAAVAAAAGAAAALAQGGGGGPGHRARVAASGVLPRRWRRAAGRWRWACSSSRSAATCGGCGGSARSPCCPRRSTVAGHPRVRRPDGRPSLACAVVWFALVVPNDLNG